MLRSRPYRVSCSRIGHIDVPSTMFRAPPPESVEIVESEAAPSVPREPRDDAMLARMPAISAVPFTRVHLSRAFWAERLVPNPHEHHPHGAREVRRAGRRRALRQRPRRDRGRHRLPVYPWDGAVRVTLRGLGARRELALSLRVPGWARDEVVPSACGATATSWCLELPMPAHRRPPERRGRSRARALSCGPLSCALEGCAQSEGEMSCSKARRRRSLSTRAAE